MQCVGTESSIDECPANDWGVNDCSHFEDAGVVCQGSALNFVFLVSLMQVMAGGNKFVLRVNVFSHPEMCVNLFHLLSLQQGVAILIRYVWWADPTLPRVTSKSTIRTGPTPNGDTSAATPGTRRMPTSSAACSDMTVGCCEIIKLPRKPLVAMEVTELTWKPLGCRGNCWVAMETTLLC